MENFFQTPKQDNSEPLIEQYDNMRDNYKQIFIEAAESIRNAVNEFKPENPCTNCHIKDCKIETKDMFAKYPSGCAYKDWQSKIITFLNGDYQQKLKNTLTAIMDKQKEYSCGMCGECCRLAVSEFSYSQLKQKAMRGDKGAADFVSVFVPYESEEDARKVNPEYFDLLNNVTEDVKVYYYYCPKVSENKCSDYENRPDVCKEFPHNPLKLLPAKCSFNVWKKSVAKTSMMLHAKIDIINYYKKELG
ncbi:MAG: YkgJ family cysteine cluster protein [bacterium]|nr:YkgJ family cysteine cluster protein [bacterium]